MLSTVTERTTPEPPVSRDPFAIVTGGHTLAQAVVETLQEPFLVLGEDLHVVAVSRSFCARYAIEARDVIGRAFASIGNGQWDVPGLHDLLLRVLPGQKAVEGFEFAQDIAGTGARRVLLSARSVVFEGTDHKMILIAMEDITVWRAAETAFSALLEEKEIHLREMQHRVANSLQILASILLIKARSLQGGETREQLQDAHQRVMSIAAVQEQLRMTREGDVVAIKPYLQRLCGSLAASMLTPTRPIAIDVRAMNGEARANDAVSLGLIVTELLINAVKHAFPAGQPDAAVHVVYETVGTGWSLEVQDNGSGCLPGPEGTIKVGLGTSIVEALARKLGAVVEVASTSHGMHVTVRTVPDAALPDSA